MSLAGRAFVALQHVLPLHGISTLMHALARVESPAVKNALIRGFLSLYEVNLGEAERVRPAQYASFNDFFTRALKAGARPIDADPRAIVSPCDGAVSQIGELDGDRLLQSTVEAKRHTYTLEALFADPLLAQPYVGGSFACIYLAPRDYHRVHMPLAGRLRGALHVPGALYSVNTTTARYVPGLFARNERLVLSFDTTAGPLAVILVGALNVGSMSLAWCGDVAPDRGRSRTPRALPAPPLELAAGDELGRFNLGSTVILVLPPGACRWRADAGPGTRVTMGTRLGSRP
jgi:phosphatidylserine decarboxylase